MSIIDEWLESLAIPSLGKYGIDANHIDNIVNHNKNKDNPIKLAPEQIKEILLHRIR